MPLFKVMNSSGAFINDTLYREGEVVELPEGENPNWGVRVDEQGNELENYNEKVSNLSKLNEQLAKSIEGKSPTAEQNAELAKENIELKKKITGLEGDIAEIKSMLGGSNTAAEAPNEPTETAGESDGAENATSETQLAGGDSDGSIEQQIDNAVKMLEDNQDDQWTARGEPKLDLLQEIVGVPVSRAQVDAINNRRREKEQPTQ